MAASSTLPQPEISRKFRSGVLTVSGFGLKIKVDRGHLYVEEGISSERRTFRIPRVAHGLKRLVVISSDGFVSLGALCWLADQNTAFVMLDRRGKPLVVSGPVASSDSKLRRAQALAVGNGVALRISRNLIDAKLHGQAVLVNDMLHNHVIAQSIALLRNDISHTENIERLRLIESKAAKLYWGAWSDVAVRWPRSDELRVPEHWKRFGSRVSPLTHSPRLAANPPNAILNLLYGLLEAECRLAAVAMGLDPALGVLHVDAESRDSLACDLMEACRPNVDVFVLHWLRSEPLRKADFFEDTNGNCCLKSPLAAKLCETASTWRKFVGPVAEYVAQELWASTSKRRSSPVSLATRLTQQHKREVKGSAVPKVAPAPQPQSICRLCGNQINRGQKYCLNCARTKARENLTEVAKLGRVAAQTPEAQGRRSVTMRRHDAARQAWSPSLQPEWLTPEAYKERIQPNLQKTSIPAIAQILGVSEPYAAAIRAGKCTPHPRHWLALARMVGIFAGSLKGSRESLP